MSDICKEKLGVTTEYIIDLIKELNRNGPIGTDYISSIAESCIGDIVDDMIASADNEDWDCDDLRMAFGRVLCKKLNCEV